MYNFMSNVPVVELKFAYPCESYLSTPVANSTEKTIRFSKDQYNKCVLGGWSKIYGVFPGRYQEGDTVAIHDGDRKNAKAFYVIHVEGHPDDFTTDMVLIPASKAKALQKKGVKSVKPRKAKVQVQHRQRTKEESLAYVARLQAEIQELVAFRKEEREAVAEIRAVGGTENYLKRDWSKF